MTRTGTDQRTLHSSIHSHVHSSVSDIVTKEVFITLRYITVVQLSVQYLT